MSGADQGVFRAKESWSPSMMRNRPAARASRTTQRHNCSRPRRFSAAIRVSACREKPREAKHSGPVRTPVAGSRSTRRSLWPARSPVAMKPRTEAAVGSQHRLFVAEGIYLGIVEQAAFGTQANDPVRAHLHDLLHVVGGQRRRCHEPWSFLPVGIDPVKHEHVHVRIDVQRRSESLHEGYRTAAPIGVPQRLRLLSIPATHYAQKHPQRSRNQLTVPCKPVADLIRKLSTNCRTGTRGSSSSTRRAAVSAIRRPAHELQKPRFLHENATARLVPHCSQRALTNP